MKKKVTMGLMSVVLAASSLGVAYASPQTRSETSKLMIPVEEANKLAKEKGAAPFNAVDIATAIADSQYTYKGGVRSGHIELRFTGAGNYYTHDSYFN